MKTISVIIPVYNGEKYIERCFASLTAQTVFPDLEILFVDDGSTDHSGSMLDSYQSDFNNVSVYHISNHGVSYARNLGLEKSHGEYISFLDADDWLEKNHYEELLKHAEGDCDIVCSGYFVEYPDKTVTQALSGPRCLNNDEVIRSFLRGGELDINIWDKLFRRSLVKDIRFDTTLIIGEDKYFCFRYLSLARKAKLIPFVGYHYYMNEDSVTHRGFSAKKLESAKVSRLIFKGIQETFPQYVDLAESSLIDSNARLVGDMYRSGAQKQYKEAYDDAYRLIRRYSIIKKAKYSTGKHFLSFLLIRIHPALYVAMKYGLRLQYR